MMYFPSKCYYTVSAKLVYNVLILVSLLASCSSTSQEIIAKNGSFGIDEKNKIIVWHQEDLQSLLDKTGTTKQITFGQVFELVGESASLSYTTPSKVKFEENTYDLYITKLPIVQVSVNNEVKDNVKIAGDFSYFFEDNLITHLIGIEHRGNLSLTYPKKTYDLEFWTDSVQKTSADVKFQGLKKDDDFILDGLYNEPLRLRSTMASKLWKKVHKPYYLNSEPKARSGVDVRYVELFKNESYQGIYALSESVDHSLMELKKNEGKQIHGELFKASSYEGAPSFIKAPEYNNLFPHWAGFEMEYPIVDYKSHWENISEFVNLVVYAKDKQFVDEIEKWVHLDNVIDYYLFVNLLRATDNLGKNYYLARYNENAPFFFVPWDLDGVMGIIQDGKPISTTNDMLSNGLFDRLLKSNPNGFKDKLKHRWKILRKSEYSDEALFSALENTYTYMKVDKLYARERKIWPSEITEADHYIYLKEWLTKRLEYLDYHFGELSSTSENSLVR